MATPTPPADDLRALVDALKDIYRRLETLERPDATQKGSLVAQVQAALANINATVAAAISANSYTKAQIDARITNPGLVGNVSTTASARFDGGIASTGVNANDLSGAGGGSKIVYSNNTTGALGYLPSSRDMKQDISPATFPYDKLRAVTAYWFRYKSAVEAHGDDAYVWLNAMAEDLDSAGFTALVDYDSTGKAVGVYTERLWVIPQMLSVAQAGMIEDLTARLAKVEKAVLTIRL